jgi:glycosyltransferase involved in cell wall biosynthesis
MEKITEKWICCQLGAREHYAIPRSLFEAGRLAHLITDTWIPSNSLINALPNSLLLNLRERFHPDLAQASIYSLTKSSLKFELTQKLKKKRGWERIIARNRWFQQKAVQLLPSLSPDFLNPPVLFAYSYAALEIFRYAKSQDWTTILGQIDPGLVEEQLVLKEHKKYPDYQTNWQPAPPQYWENWLEECLLADHIIVNSSWSSQALQQVGISPEKINVIPLAYQPPKKAQDFPRVYPPQFSHERPLRVLFLGQVILRKGIAAVIESAKFLRDQPIEFWIVGPQGVKNLAPSPPNIRWMGKVARSATAQYYQQADVFLFPTLSDGFALTQLEAQAWKLPIIASKFCGEVVKDQVNGLVLEEVTGEAIVQILIDCMKNPQKLDLFSRQASNLNRFNLPNLYRSLQTLSDNLV